MQFNVIARLMFSLHVRPKVITKWSLKKLFFLPLVPGCVGRERKDAAVDDGQQPQQPGRWGCGDEPCHEAEGSEELGMLHHREPDGRDEDAASKSQKHGHDG